MAPNDDRTCWLVKAGRSGRMARTLVEQGVVAVGEEWKGLGDLALHDDAAVYTKLEDIGRKKPKDDLVQARILSTRMAVGDLVVTPDGPSGDLLFGDVTGEYNYYPAGPAASDVHQRPVDWFGRLPSADLEPFLVKAVSWRGGRVRRLPEQVHWLRISGEIRDGMGRPADDFPKEKGKAKAASVRASRATAAPSKVQPTGVPQQLCPACGLLRAASMFPDDDEYCRDCA